MRVLITGYSGFAGGHLAEHILANTDWKVWGTVFGSREGPARSDERVTEVLGDLLDAAFLRKVVADAAPELVFHLAGQSSVQDAWTDPWPTFETNVRLQLLLLDALAEKAPRARLVAVTSNEVYGLGRPDGRAADETTPLAPINPYALSKVSQDTLAEMVGRARDLDVVRIRPFTHVGPGQSEVFVTASFACQVARIESGLQEPVIRVGNLDAQRDFTDVRDTVRAYHLAAQAGRRGEVYNVGTGTARSIREILDWFVARAGVSIEVARDPSRVRPADVPRTLCDASKARRDLGWEPAIPMEETLADILAYWRARVGGAGD